MLRLRLGMILGVLLLNLSPLEAQTTTFGDGLSMELPPGWKATLEDTKSKAPEPAGNSFEHDPVTLLLHARPPEGGASLTVLRSEIFGEPHAGPMATQSALARLAEIAGEQGYRTENPLTRGGSGAPGHSATMAEVTGVSGAGDRRTFVCVSISRSAQVKLHCFWQWDEADAAMRQVFDQWLASMAVAGENVAGLLKDGGERHVSAPAQPAPANPLAGVVSRKTPSEPAAEPTPASAPASLSREAGEFTSKAQASLVVVEGSRGRGSGFVCTLEDGKPYLVTNAHVLSNNPQPKFQTMNGVTLTPGAAALGVESDIFKAVLPDGTPSLALMTDADGLPKIGDAVAVLGNSEGAGVVKVLEGKIVGLGPNLIEVDAPFVSGNSGSPIIHLATGKVIGIATYLMMRQVDKKGQPDVATNVRRFGYRPDKTKAWEPLDWNRFYAQSAQADKIYENGEEFIKLFRNAHAQRLISSDYSNTGIRRSLETMERAIQGGGPRMSAADIARAKRDLMSNLRNAALSDVNAFDNRTAYDYFRRKVAEEKKFREEIAADFTREIEASR